MRTITNTVKFVQEAHKLLESESLQPSPLVNGVFEDLMLISTAPHRRRTAERVVRELGTLLPRFRSLQARAEYLLELEYTNNALSSADPKAVIKSFPYFMGYTELIDAEYATLSHAVKREVREIAIAGSGPLPLSAILLATRYGVSSICIEREPEAVSVSRQLIAKLGLEDSIKIVEIDISNIQCLGDFVFLAALAGESATEKQSLIEKLHSKMTPGSYLCARTVEGLGALHYYPLSSEDLAPFNYITTARTKAPALNISLLAQA